MRKLITLMFAIILTIGSCTTERIVSSEDSPETIALVYKYLAEGLVLSEEAPAEGYHSPREALFETARDLVGYPFMQLEFEGDVRTWLLECEIHEPILVHNFCHDSRGETYANYFYYYIYATHPTYGIVGDVVYEYNENSQVQWGISEISPPEIRENPEYDFVSEEKAIQILEEYLGTEINAEPIAVSMPLDYPVALQNFYWYFEFEDSRSLDHTEYLVNNISEDGAMSRSMQTVPSILELKNPLYLHDVIEQTKRGINSRSLSGIPDVPVLVEGDAYEQVQ